MIGSKLTKVASFVTALVLCVALLPATALAASSTCQAYNPQLCSVTTTTPTATSVPATSTLPFTGLDVALLVAGGVVLMGAGVLVRMASRRMNN
jgi:hypothetical protein